MPPSDAPTTPPAGLALRAITAPPGARSGLLSLAGCAVAGWVAALGWPPWEWWPWAIVSHAVLAAAVFRAPSAWQAAGRAGVFTLALHATGHGWVMGTLDELTQLSAPVAIVTSVAAGFYLCLFSMLPTWIWHRAFGPQASRVAAPARGLAALAWVALMVIGESVRAEASAGLSSLALGYALIDTPWAAWVPVAGTHAVSLAALSLAAAMALLPRWRASLVPLALAVALGAAAPALDRDWVTPAGRAWTYALVQTHTPQRDKYQPGTRSAQLEQLQQLVTAQTTELIVTPETAVPQLLHELPAGTVRSLQQHADRHGSHILLGITTASPGADGRNSVVHIAPGAQPWRQLHKTRLMPFGESTPPGLHWFTQAMDVPMQDLAPGPAGQSALLLVGLQSSLRIGAVICQEELFADVARQWVRPRPDSQATAGVLINPTNMAWFDGTPAVGQRLQVARMRALEAGRPLLRVANTGITAHIDHRGAVLAQLPVQVATALQGRVQPMQGYTPFARWGPILLWLACAGLVAVAAGACWIRGRQAR